MSPLQLYDPKNTAPASDGLVGRSTATPATVSTTQDRLWQQAMHQAQQSGFADWFAGPGPTNETSPVSDGPPVNPRVSMRAHAFRWTQEDTGASPESTLVHPADPGAVGGQDSSAAGLAAASPPLEAKLDAPATLARSGPTVQQTQGNGTDVAVDRIMDVGTALMRDFARVGVAVSVSVATAPEPAQAVSSASNANRWSALELAEEPPSEPSHGDAAPDTADAEPSPAARRSTAPQAANENDPVRVHAEWSAAGVRVWLGAEAGALSAAHELAGQLQGWLANHGERLLGLICNGRAMTLPRSTPPHSSATDVDAEAPSLPIYPPIQEVP